MNIGTGNLSAGQSSELNKDGTVHSISH